MECAKIDFSRHAMQRIFERAISPEEVRAALASGEIIAAYPEDKPHPSMLLLSFVHGRPLHVVVALEEKTGYCHVVTVYVPDASKWGEDYKTRRQK